MKLHIADVNKSDARKLIYWWNANTGFYYFAKQNRFNKLFSVYKQLK